VQHLAYDDIIPLSDIHEDESEVTKSWGEKKKTFRQLFCDHRDHN